jgi:hypothetical protein
MKRIIKLFPEIVAIPFLVIAWIGVTRVLPIIFPAAGIIDEGIIQVPIIAVVFSLCFNLAVYAGIKYNEPFLWKWYKENFEESSSPYSAWLFVVMYSVRLLSMAITAIAIA